jgi:hypothetical protein
MNVDMFVTVEQDILLVEYAYCNLHFDLHQVQRQAYKQFGDDYDYATVDGEVVFTYLHDDDKYDIINDLIYYFDITPLHITIDSQNKKTKYTK